MIVYSKSFYEFLKNSDCKIAKILVTLSNKRYTPRIITNEEINYITFRGDGSISFLPFNKPHKINEDTECWLRDGRQSGKPGKIIRKLFTKRIQKYLKEEDFECFSNLYKANYNDKGYQFKILSNNEIPNVYDMELSAGEGSLNGSCMNNDSSYLDIYKYCDSVSILILKNEEDLLCGRALIWKIDDITLMDRIYVTQDFMYDKFLNYSKENNYWRKKDYKSYDNKTIFINSKGEQVIKHFTIKTDCSHSEYPYIDTFSYGDDVSLYNFEEGNYTYNNTNGSRDEKREEHEGEVYDDINEEWIDEDDAIYINAGQRCFKDRYCDKKYCVVIGDDVYYEHDDNIVEVDDNWYFIYSGEIVEVNDTWYTIHSDEICCIDNEYYLIDSDEICYVEEKDSHYLIEDCVYIKEEDNYILKENAVEIHGKYFNKKDII